MHISGAKTKALISCITAQVISAFVFTPVTAQPICVFVLAYAEWWFSGAAAYPV